MKITAHCIVRNEDVWIWFAINSVLPFIDQILVFDTGSTDKTVDVIKSIKSPKIIFEQKGPVDKKGLVELRQVQLERTKSDWFLILDGDEIWPSVQLEKLISAASSVPLYVAALFNRTRNCIGDVYHFLPDEAGNYVIAGKKGHLNIRLIKKTADLKVSGEYPLESYVNKNGPLEKQDRNLQFVDCWYLHTTFLKRSSHDKNKTSGSFGKNKIPELGLRMDNHELPEVLFTKRLSLVPDPLQKRGIAYNVISTLATPIITMRRKLL